MSDANENPAGERNEPPVVVLGGSITTSPDGRLWTLQTHSMYPTPESVQNVWSTATQKRYPTAWEGLDLEHVGHIIEWEPRKITCRSCGRSLGDYVAYRIIHPDRSPHAERGLVEDTSRRYEQQAELAKRQIAGRGPKSKPRYWLEGKPTFRAIKTAACFRCPGCRREYRRNLAKLGKQLFDQPSRSPFVLD